MRSYEQTLMKKEGHRYEENNNDIDFMRKVQIQSELLARQRLIKHFQEKKNEMKSRIV